MDIYLHSMCTLDESVFDLPLFLSGPFLKSGVHPKCGTEMNLNIRIDRITIKFRLRRDQRSKGIFNRSLSAAHSENVQVIEVPVGDLRKGHKQIALVRTLVESIKNNVYLRDADQHTLQSLQKGVGCGLLRSTLTLSVEFF